MSLFASEHYVNSLQIPSLDYDAIGVKAHYPSRPPEAHAILVVYDEQLLKSTHMDPFETHFLYEESKADKHISKVLPITS